MEAIQVVTELPYLSKEEEAIAITQRKKFDEIRKRNARNINRRSTDSDESDSATETDK